MLTLSPAMLPFDLVQYLLASSFARCNNAMSIISHAGLNDFSSRTPCNVCWNLMAKQSRYAMNVLRTHWIFFFLLSFHNGVEKKILRNECWKKLSAKGRKWFGFPVSTQLNIFFIKMLFFFMINSYRKCFTLTIARCHAQISIQLH